MQATLLSLLLVGLTHSAFAAIYITSPVDTTTAQGGQSLTINWQDDMSSPSLSAIGPCEVGLFAGNRDQQTELQQVNPSVDVSTQTSVSFNVNPAIGSNSGAYFIRFTSIGLKDANNSQFPYEAFSAKFNLNNMSGQFNATVQAQINGITSASLPASTPAAAPAASSAPSRMATASASTTTNAITPKTSTTSSSAPKSTQPNAALMTRANLGVLSAVGAVILVGLSL